VSRVRAFAFRFETPRQPALWESDSADLTTRRERAEGRLAPDALHIAPPPEHWTTLDAPVPGTLVAGTLPPDHLARFVLKVPRDWNGRLVCAASSGMTDERTYDLWFADWAMTQGYAFAATDKGVRRAVLDGDTVLMPRWAGSETARWAGRLEALAEFSRAALKRLRGAEPERTYAFGLSNGGYVARKAAESSSGLFDGAAEAAGVLWRADSGNLLRELPAALRATATPRADDAALAPLGLDAPDERWSAHRAWYRAVYWEASFWLFAEEVDPAYDGRAEDYDLDARPEEVRERIRAFENTGELKIPLESVAARRDYLIARPGHADAYAALVRARGKGALHALEIVENGTHIDSSAKDFPFVAPLMPRARAAFERLVARVEGAATAPSSPRPR
jgi:hypothetical protein